MYVWAVACALRGHAGPDCGVAVRHVVCVINSHAKPQCADLKVLLADDDAARARAVARILAADAGLIVVRLKQNEGLAEAVASLAPDVVLVDMARPDRDALDGIRQVAALSPRPVVLFVDEDDPEFMEEAINAGVSSYNAVGLPPPDVKPILRAAVALFRRHQQAREDLKQAEIAADGTGCHRQGESAADQATPHERARCL